MDLPGTPDQKVTVGIRPEGFKLDTEGALKCSLNSIEVMGRDTSVVAGHPACQTNSFRAIIPSENQAGITPGTVRFDVKPEKVHIFDGEGKKI